MPSAPPRRPGRHPSRRTVLTAGAALAGAAGLASCGTSAGSDVTRLTFWTWAPGIEDVVALEVEES